MTVLPSDLASKCRLACECSGEGASCTRQEDARGPQRAFFCLPGFDLTSVIMFVARSYVLCGPKKDLTPGFAAKCDQFHFEINHNGNDVYQLLRGTNTSTPAAASDPRIIDVFGELSEDSRSGFTVCGVDLATKDKTLVRKAIVVHGNPAFEDQAGTNLNDCEWELHQASKAVDVLGVHECVLPATTTLIGGDFTTSTSTFTASPQTTTASTTNWAGLFISQVVLPPKR